MAFPAHGNPLILVTEGQYWKGEAVFARPPTGWTCRPAPADESLLSEEVRRVRPFAVIVGVEPYRGALYESLPRGGVVARFGVGHDGIDKTVATARGLFCTNTPGVLEDSVAEYTIALMLAAARGLVAADRTLRQEKWKPLIGLELRGKTLAVIGCGQIGCRVAQMASKGFGMRVIGCKRRIEETRFFCQQWGMERVTSEWSDAVHDADFVSLHIPLTGETRHFVDRKRIRDIPRRAWLINTARGAVVDEGALYEALSEGRMAGAALDVFEREPYEPASPACDLRTLPNVLMTPHIGSSTAEACRRVAERCLMNIQAAADGRYNEMDLLNPAVLTLCSS